MFFLGSQRSTPLGFCKALLVLSTLHALDVTETINRMIDLFPPHQHTQVRAMLAGTLKGIVG